MSGVTINVPQELTVWIFPFVFMIMFSVLTVAFVKNTRSVDSDGEVAVSIGLGLCAAAFGIMMLSMSWHLFAKSLALPGY